MGECARHTSLLVRYPDLSQDKTEFTACLFTTIHRIYGLFESGMLKSVDQTDSLAKKIVLNSLKLSIMFV